MENKQSPSKKKLMSIQEERFIREVDYLAAGPIRQTKKLFPIDLEIVHKTPSNRQGSQRVLVSIKPRAPAIKTIYIAEKSRYCSKKGSSKSGSRLAIGDHSSFTSHFSEKDNYSLNSIAVGTDGQESKIDSSKISSVLIQIESSTCDSKCTPIDDSTRVNVYNDKPRSPEKCYLYTQPDINIPRLETKVNASSMIPNKADIATLIITNTSSENSALAKDIIFSHLNKRIDYLERKILRHEMVVRALDPGIMVSSSDEDNKNQRTLSETERPGCSYIQQYSHVPETSAFQRYAHQAVPLSPSKATTIEKEHNSEQYGRDFTTYDGITARGRRQCASVPCKRDDIPKQAAERVHKIRHKLNPVRDYRLMDTVHYLAQGEFAPRDDGIKLTPSREAVLSDIIYEDVCRTHWPNTRLGRRAAAHSERCGTRCELQRLIDSLLRERVAHVERRRRRHYRIVKLNHRHENCRALGKTGDIIVASHKNRPGSEDAGSDVSPGSFVSERRREERSSRKSHRSHDRLLLPELRQRHKSKQDESSPGPSYANRSPSSREPTCCYHHTSMKSERSMSDSPPNCTKKYEERNQEVTSGSSVSANKTRSPRLIVKKDGNRRKPKEEPNLEHYILLPTLVVRTPSNMKRQKKFNELYHKILNVQMNNQLTGRPEVERKPIDKKDIGFNINITLSNSAEELNKQKHLIQK